MIVKGERFESTNIPLENEDNCVLSECDLDLLDQALEDFVEACDKSSKGWGNKEATNIFLKINKLNDMAKEKQK